MSGEKGLFAYGRAARVPRVGTANVGAAGEHWFMADIDIRELIAYEPYCAECGETGPIETSSFLAFAWEQAHSCAPVAADVKIAS